MLFISKKVLLLVLSLIMIFGLTAISAADNTTNIHEDNINRNSTSNIDANANLEAVNMQDNNKISEKNVINSNSTSKTRCYNCRRLGVPKRCYIYRYR